MDNRRLDTMQALASGILSRPVPETDIPQDRDELSVDYEWEYIGREAAEEGLEDGKVLSSSNYYGIPHLWKDDGGKYRGVLLQYRAVTEDNTWASSSEALDWFEDRCAETAG